MDLHKKYNITLSVLTPMSVGAGAESEWVKGADFVTKDNQVFILDMKKVIENGVDPSVLSELYIRGDHDGVTRIIGNKLDVCSRRIFTLPASTDNNIKAMTRSMLIGKPIIPGSSLKGAIRTSLFSYLMGNETNADKVFGTMKNGDVFTRFIQVSDIEMPDTELVNTKIFNLHKEDNEWVGGWKHGANNTSSDYSQTGFNTLYECEMPNAIGIGSITFLPYTFEKAVNALKEKGIPCNEYGKKDQILSGGISELFKIINNQTRKYLQKEKSFFEKYDAAYTQNIIDSIDSLLIQIPQDGSSCIIKMSAGVGFHSITGDYRFNNYTDGTFDRKRVRDINTLPKSRKIAIHGENFSLMGFVKIEAKDDEELRIAIQSEHQDKFSIKLQEIKDRASILEAKRKEVQEKQEALIREQKEKQEKYESLVNKAKAHAESQKFDEAITCINEASEIYPSKTDLKSLKAEYVRKAEEFVRQKNLETAKAIEDKLKQLQEEKNKQPLNKVIANATAAGTLAGYISKWLNVKGHSLGEAEINAIIEHIQNPENSKLKKDISKNKGKLKIALGNDIAQRIFNAVNIS